MRTKRKIHPSNVPLTSFVASYPNQMYRTFYFGKRQPSPLRDSPICDKWQQLAKILLSEQCNSDCKPQDIGTVVGYDPVVYKETGKALILKDANYVRHRILNYDMVQYMPNNMEDWYNMVMELNGVFYNWQTEFVVLRKSLVFIS